LPKQFVAPELAAALVCTMQWTQSLINNSEPLADVKPWCCLPMGSTLRAIVHRTKARYVWLKSQRRQSTPLITIHQVGTVSSLKAFPCPKDVEPFLDSHCRVPAGPVFLEPTLVTTSAPLHTFMRCPTRQVGASIAEILCSASVRRSPG